MKNNLINNQICGKYFPLLTRSVLPVLLILLFTNQGSSQNPVNIIITPQAKTVNVGQSFTVTIKVDFISPDSLNAAEIHLAFDKTKLSVTSITKPAVSILPTEAILLEPIDTINTKGQINYAAAKSGTFRTTDFNLLTITFKAIAGGTTTPLTFLTSFPYKTDAVKRWYSVLNTLSNSTITLVCPAPKATIAASSTCNASDVSLRLSSATGTTPFSLVVNGTTYNGVTVNSTFATVAFPVNKIWPANPTPANPTKNDGQSIQVGVKFKSSTAGFIKGIRFYNGNNNSGTYTGKLWKYSPATLLQSEDFTGVTTNGWQEFLFSTPLLIAANTVYIASYYSSAGNYANNANFFTSSGVTNGPLTALKNGASGGNGVYRYGTEIPNSTFQASNYWVDVIFSPNTNTFKLTSVIDSNGCSKSGSLQTLNVTSTVCPAGRLMNISDTSGDDIGIIPQINPGVEVQEINPYVKGQRNLAGKMIYSLGQNYPNPVNNETTVQFTLPKTEKVNLSLFDISGRVVKVLVQGLKDAGTHTISFNVGSLTKGIYYYRIQAGDFTDVKKLAIQ